MGTERKNRSILAAIGLPVRVYLGAVFVLASIHKIQVPYDFALSVATYQIIPLWLINLFAIALPWIELVTGVFLIVGFWTKENAFLILGMMIMFTVALILVLAQGYEMTCGCFASQEAAEQIGIPTLLRDLLWIALAGFTLLFDDGRFGVDGILRRQARHA